MCCITGCTSASAPVANSPAWGFSGAICQDHWTIFDTGVKTKPLAVPQVCPHDPAYLDDYKRLAALMLDRTTVEQAMATLDYEIAQAKVNAEADDERFSGKTHANYARLSRILECYEGFCWFPSTHMVYAGAVPADLFLQNLTSGFMPKDPGAGFLHGDFSHRLQWHVVMRAVTNNFTVAVRVGWDHSPLELYASLGSALASARGLWGYIFDRQNGVKYQDPSTLEEFIRRSGAAVLAPNLQRRFDKRKALERAIEDYLKTKGLEFKIAAADVHAVLYRWRKVGSKPLFTTKPQEKIAEHFWPQMVADPVKDYEKWGSPAVLKRKGETPPTQGDVMHLMQFSRHSFNLHNFVFDAGQGARRR